MPHEGQSDGCCIRPDLINHAEMGIIQRNLVILGGAIRTPPLSLKARCEIGFLIRNLQRGLSLEMPQSRPMPSIGGRCQELRVTDGGQAWRVIFRIDPDAILVLAVFNKKTRKTPRKLIDNARRLLERYDS